MNSSPVDGASASAATALSPRWRSSPWEQAYRFVYSGGVAAAAATSTTAAAAADTAAAGSEPSSSPSKQQGHNLRGGVAAAGADGGFSASAASAPSHRRGGGHGSSTGLAASLSGAEGEGASGVHGQVGHAELASSPAGSPTDHHRHTGHAAIEGSGAAPSLSGAKRGGASGGGGLDSPVREGAGGHKNSAEGEHAGSAKRRR